MDPLSDVLSLLKPCSYIAGGFDVGGELSVRFGRHDGIKCYAVVSGQCWLSVEGVPDAAHLETGDCFGEASYVPGAKRTATIRSASDVTVLKVSSTLLEQVSASCQLRFNRVFLSSLISRLQNAESIHSERFRG